jgi:predicted nuclease with TOPRIM domain
VSFDIKIQYHCSDNRKRASLREDIRKLGKNGPLADRTSLEERRRRLETQINSYHDKMDLLLDGLECEDVRTNSLLSDLDEEFDADADEMEEQSLEGDNINDADEDEDILPEKMSLFLPSSLELADLHRFGLMDLATKELKLRKGQANDALDKLRLALGHKALLFRTQVSI